MPKKETKKTVINNTGKRKTSVARVFLYKGNGEKKVNNKDCERYFLSSPYYIKKINEPFDLVNSDLGFISTVRGGGLNSQAEALRLGISKCLAKDNPKYKLLLRDAGLLTRDSRTVESKKAGRKKARKGNQFSKR